MSKQEELIQALAEKWTAQKWGWEVDVMNEEYKEFISDLRTLLSQLVPGEEELKRDCSQTLTYRMAAWLQGARYVINRLTGKE